MRLGRTLGGLAITSVVAASLGVATLVPAAAPAAAAGFDSSVQGIGTATAIGGYNGSVGGVSGLNKPLITMASTPSGQGYWLASGDGGIFTFGDANFFGSLGGIRLNEPVVDMVSTTSAMGYWMVSTDGGIFTFGDADFLGSLGGIRLNQPVVTMIPTPTGKGYWMFSKDGGVFSFGDAPFYGSLGGHGGIAPIVDALVRPQGDGYWLISETGEVYEFGGAPEFGDLPASNITPNGRVVGGATTPSGLGFWLLASDGVVYPYGDAAALGNATVPVGQIATGISAMPDGQGYFIAITTGLRASSSGASGPEVLALQQRLSAFKFWVDNPDGNYGSLTSQAVMAFQKYYRLRRTGVADDETIAALVGAGPAQAASTSGDLIEIDLARQLIFVVVGGQTVAALNTSTGSGVPYREVLPDGRVATGDAVTYTGKFKVHREISDGWRISDLGRLWRPKYFDGGIAVHGSTSIPGYPASHGCARLSIAAMDWIWANNYMPMGRTVWVY